MESRTRVGLAASVMVGLPVLAYLLRDSPPVYQEVTQTVAGGAGATLAAVLAVVFFPRTRRALIWTALVAAVTFLTWTPGGPGTLYVSGVPLVFGAWAGSRSIWNAEPAGVAERTAFSCTFLGILLGGDLLYIATAVVPLEGYIAVVGGGGVADGLVLAPALAAAWTGMWRGLVDGAEPEDEDETGWGMATIRRWLGHRAHSDTRAWLNSGWATAAAFWLAASLG